MANELRIKDDTPIVWANDTDYVGGITGYIKTHLLTLQALAANAARQGEKADLGIKRPGGYVVKAAVNFAVTPTAGGPVEYYWSSSIVNHPASGNTGGVTVSGVDNPWLPPGGLEADIDEWKQQLTFVGILPVAADANAAQVKVINSYFTPPERYGSFVVKNDTSQSLATAGSGLYVALIPVIDELQ